MPRNFSLTAKLTEDQAFAVKALAERDGVVPSEWNRRLVERELAGQPDMWFLAAEIASLAGTFMATMKAVGTDPAVIREARKSADRLKLQAARARWAEFRGARGDSNWLGGPKVTAQDVAAVAAEGLVPADALAAELNGELPWPEEEQGDTRS